MIETVLVANRGEIALRIVRACRDLGLRTIAVYSDADIDSPHVAAADFAVNIGPAPAAQSYLDGDAIIRAAIAHGATAVHPGYGFLSEQAAFAESVKAAGLIFVGPSPAAMRELGDKRSARQAAERAGLPVVLGAAISDSSSPPDLVDALGLPLLIKAAFGGGGRGMRVVRDLAELAGAIEAARRESGSAFGRDDVFAERFVEYARHVEVQVVADGHGNVVHLGTRDCTVQRRHQKLIEEAPAINLPDRVLAGMLDGAVRLARDVGYVGVGTVEFLFDRNTDEFYFLEVNTRLQVEHTVTEMVTGIDIVALQLRIAAGEPLLFGQDDVRVDGHAIQVRINAEDASDDFRPAAGRVSQAVWPMGPWVRCDTSISSGAVVPPNYDSLLAKVMAVGPNREIACRRLGRALRETTVVGLATTGPFLGRVLEHPTFATLEHWTTFIDSGAVDTVDVSPATGQDAPPPFDDAGPALAKTVALHIATTTGAFEVVVPTIADELVAASTAGHVSTTRTSTFSETSGAGCVAPMDCTLISHAVAPGDEVARGDTVAIVESMKMETHVASDRDGVVKAVHHTPGDSLRRGDVLVEVDDV
ncbi:MAG: biotin carboxylase N-terminal domain-containing protein [Microthrixaceae bacterium]